MKTTIYILKMTLPLAFLFIAVHTGFSQYKSAVAETKQEHMVSGKLTVMVSAWFPFDITAGQPTQPQNQRINDLPSPTPPTGDCDVINIGELCSVHLQFDETNTDVHDLLAEIEDAIANSQPVTVTVDDLISAGATYTIPSNPEYARKL